MPAINPEIPLEILEEIPGREDDELTGSLSDSRDALPLDENVDGSSVAPGEGLRLS